MVDSVFFDKRDDRLDDLLHAEFYLDLLDADVLDWKPTTGKTTSWHLKNWSVSLSHAHFSIYVFYQFPWLRARYWLARD